MSENWLTTKEVAERLGKLSGQIVTARSVRKLCRISELPYTHMFNEYRIPESELLRWMDAHKIRRQ
jgi:excisionase family DNA binding protein